jgi:hypothetical protein
MMFWDVAQSISLDMYEVSKETSASTFRVSIYLSTCITCHKSVIWKRLVQAQYLCHEYPSRFRCKNLEG